MRRPAQSSPRRSGRRAGVLAILGLAAVAGLACRNDGAAPSGGEVLACPGCNVVLLSLDTVRADRLSVYGHDRPTSPQLERLATEAVVFERFYNAGGSTLPSHASMMTGLHPAAHGSNRGNREPVPEAAEMLAERFAAGGFHAAGFADGGWIRRQFGFAQGFAEWDERGGHFRRILPKVEEWLASAPPEPFFLFVHTYDAHSKPAGAFYTCPEEFAGRWADEHPGAFPECRDGRCSHHLLLHAVKRVERGEATLGELFDEDELAYLAARYDGCLGYVDDGVGRIVAALREAGLWDRTILAVTSDHGEEFGEHGRVLHLQSGWSEAAHVPLVLKLPGSRYGGARVPHLASMVDLAPTLLDLVGLEPPPAAQGRSLVPAITEDRPTRRFASSEHALRTAEWTYLRPAVEPGVEPPMIDAPRLYAASDAGERRDRAADEAAVATELDRALDRILAADRETRQRLDRGEGAADAVSEEVRRELEALGYVD